MNPTVFSPFYLIDQLIAQGSNHFCIAPGAQSIPLVKVAAEHPLATTKVHFDERGLGFYALGIAKASKKPAVIITTSGSALFNLLPAIVEAHHSKTAMIILSADRPLELKECGDNQTTDHLRALFPYLRFQFDLPFEGKEHFFRSVAAQSYFHATQSPNGVVHINCQIQNRGEKIVVSSFGKKIETPSPIIATTPQKIDAQKGLISIGAINEPIEPILSLAKRLKWPVIADILSNARTKSFDEEIRYFEPILTNHPEIKPEFHLHFGERFISKSHLLFPADMHVSSDPFLQDPTRNLKAIIRSSIEPFCSTLQAEVALSSWLEKWKALDQTYAKMIEETMQDFIPQKSFHEENQWIYRLGKKTSSQQLYFFGTSMPIRIADRYFFPKSAFGYFANRGISGIDGIIATIAGIADASKKSVVAVIGDQTALHDLNSLALIKKAKYPITLIIINNYGGRIFSRLALEPWEKMEQYIESEHSFSFKSAADFFKIPYIQLEETDFSFSSIIEVTCSKEDSLELEKRIFSYSSPSEQE